MYVLNSDSEHPPGSFPYKQEYKVNGETKTKSFPAEGLDKYQQAIRILNFRAGNKLPGATREEVLRDLIEYTCARLGNDPRFCHSTDKPFNQVVPMAGTGCGGCLK